MSYSSLLLAAGYNGTRDNWGPMHFKTHISVKVLFFLI